MWPHDQGMRSLRRILIGRSLRRTLLRASLTALVLVFVGRTLLRPAFTRGLSMEPTVSDGSFHLLNLQAYRWAAPQRGDVVVIRVYGGRSMYLKRIVGLPGETVGFSEGDLYINGRHRQEPYVHLFGSWNIESVTLEEDEYFVVGDNRSTPPEAHLMGRVGAGDIAGKLLW